MLQLRKVQKSPPWCLLLFPLWVCTQQGVLEPGQTVQQDGDGHGFLFSDVFTLQGLGSLPGCRESLALNSCLLTPSPLPLQEMQSRTLCSVQNLAC